MSRTPISFSQRNYLESFRKKYPLLAVSNEEYYNILNTAGQVMKDTLFEDGEIKMGNRLGVLMIRKFKPKGKGSSFAINAKEVTVDLLPAMPFDKPASRAAGKAIYQFNDHTGGFIFRILWFKKSCKMIDDKNMWTFKAIRSLKRSLAFNIKNNSADYPEHSPAFETDFRIVERIKERNEI